MFRMIGDWVRICAPVSRMRSVASFTAGVLSSRGWLKCAMIERCRPVAVMRRKMSSISSASSSVVNRYGQ